MVLAALVFLGVTLAAAIAIFAVSAAFGVCGSIAWLLTLSVTVSFLFVSLLVTVAKSMD